jgi:ribosome-binding factor A
MLNRELTTQQKRIESLYDREIRIAVYKVTHQWALPFLPISYCKADKKFQAIRIHVAMENNPENLKLIEDFNKKYVNFISKELISVKRFRRIPKLIFQIDNELIEINKLEELIKED